MRVEVWRDRPYRFQARLQILSFGYGASYRRDFRNSKAQTGYVFGSRVTIRNTGKDKRSKRSGRFLTIPARKSLKKKYWSRVVFRLRTDKSGAYAKSAVPCAWNILV